MQYEIIRSRSTGELEEKIHTYLDRGWILQGGVSVTVNHYNALTFVQAVTKED